MNQIKTIPLPVHFKEQIIRKFQSKYKMGPISHRQRNRSKRAVSGRYRAVDLFCGVGGLSAGLALSGIDIVAAFDNWPTAIDAYRRNLGDHAFLLDLSDIPNAVESISEYRPDIIVGGPPCQDFSSSGKRIEGDRANLTVSFAEIVSQCLPPYFVMENVPRVRFSSAYQHLLEMLQNRGYKFYESILDASLCGVPQMRKRLFLIGFMKDSVAIQKIHNCILSSISKSRLTVKEYLGNDIDIDFYYRHPRNYSRRAVFSVHEPSPTIRGVNRPVPPNYKQNSLDSADPASVRPLTSWERSRIQTFNVAWDWGHGSSNRNTDVEQLIGNAVPVNLGRFVGSAFINAISA